jgi:hypothetical protein
MSSSGSTGTTPTPPLPPTFPPLDLSKSNLVMMVYRQAVLVLGITCLFFFKSPMRDTVLFVKSPTT